MVEKILIFEKSKLWKAFVQMDCKESAIKVRENLNDTRIINESIYMNIHYSNLNQVTFVNNNSGGIDYRYINEQQKAYC